MNLGTPSGVLFSDFSLFLYDFPVDKYPCRVYNAYTHKGYFPGKERKSMNENQTSACPACARKTVRGEEEKKKLLNRLSRIEGQVRGVRKMIENDAYCNDVLMQSAAITAAVNAFNREVLRAHVHSCWNG